VAQPYDLVYQFIWQEGFEKGFQQGSLQGLHQLLIRHVQKCFPVLVSLAEEQSILIEDVEILFNIVDVLFDAKTIEEARRVLEVAHQGQ
jgi:hypothetical protein